MAIPKIVNCRQFNGQYGCIHCHNPGKQLKKPKKRVYLYSKKYEIRTNNDYMKQVKEANDLKKPVKGILGKCWISKHLKLPKNILLDYMHVSCIGTLETILKLWLNKSKKTKWYLSKLI